MQGQNIMLIDEIPYFSQLSTQFFLFPHPFNPQNPTIPKSSIILRPNPPLQRSLLAWPGQSFIGIIISASMSSDPDKRSPSSRRRIIGRPTVYCLFASQQSCSAFQTYHTSKKTNQVDTLRKTEESSENEREADDVFLIRDEQLELTPIPKVSKLYHCRKCFKELDQSEQEQGRCEECVYMTRLVQTGNFQRFIGVLIDFKVRSREANTQQYKLRRIDSIQSIQSFTLDRLHDSQQIKTNSHFYHVRKDENVVLNSMENSMNNLKKSQTNESAQGGYFCNGCGTAPILGRRFHCLTCEDYDLCERCYFYTGHKHDMKTYKDMREDIAKKAREGAIKQSQSLQNTLPFLSTSIRNFQNASRLFNTTAFKKP